MQAATIVQPTINKVTADPCPICGRNINRQIIAGRLDPYVRAGHKCPHGISCAASNPTLAPFLNGVPPQSQACCRKGRTHERTDIEDGSL